MRRRTLLGTAGSTLSALLAGCVGTSDTTGGGGGSGGLERGPIAHLTMGAVSDADIGRRTVPTVDRWTEEDHRFVHRIIENESVTTTGEEPPVPTSTPVEVDDDVYRFSHEVTDRQPATRYDVTIDPVGGAVDDGGTVRFDELPAVDREHLASVGLEDGDPLGIGTTLVYTDPGRERSALVPDPRRSVVVWESDRRGRFTVDDADETTLDTYRYTAEQVAPTVEAYGRRLREESAFVLAGLARGERDVVERAIENERGHVVESGTTPSSPFRSIVDRFRLHDAIEGGRDASPSGEYLVRYDERTYWAELRVDEGVVENATVTDEGT